MLLILVLLELLGLLYKPHAISYPLYTPTTSVILSEAKNLFGTNAQCNAVACRVALPFRLQDDIRHNHLLHRYTAVLKGVAIVADMAVGVVVIDQKIVVVRKNITRRQVNRRQLHLFGFGNLEHLLRVVRQIAACLVAQIGGCLAVALHPYRIIDTHRTVVGGDDDRVAVFREQTQQRKQVGMFKPRAGQRAERSVVLGQFADDVGLGTRMRQDVEEIIDDNRKIGFVNMADVVD